MPKGEGPPLFRGFRQDVDLGLHRGVWLDVIRHHKSGRGMVDGGNNVGREHHRPIQGVDVNGLLAPSVSGRQIDRESFQYRGATGVCLDL